MTDLTLDLAKHQRLKAELKANGYSISRIANDLGVTVTTVIIVSQGHRKSARVQAAIAEALNRKPEEIWPDRYETAKTSTTRMEKVELRYSQKSSLDRHLSELRAERIKRRLREVGCSIKMLSTSLGIYGSDIRAIMLGEKWSDHIEGEIAKILNVRAADLWPERYDGSVLSTKPVAKRAPSPLMRKKILEKKLEKKLEKQRKHREATVLKAEQDGMLSKAVRYKLLLSGHSNAEIASELNLKANTVAAAIAGRSKSPKVISNVSNKIGMSFDDLWFAIHGETAAPLVKAAGQVKGPKRNKTTDLTPEQTEFIRKMWLDPKYSSRRIAAETNVSLGKLNRTFGPRGMDDKLRGR